VRVGRLDNCIADFLRTGHSKTSADRLFANIATTLAAKDYFNHLYVQLSFQYKEDILTNQSQHATQYHKITGNMQHFLVE
jgi:hypothetical protein